MLRMKFNSPFNHHATNFYVDSSHLICSAFSYSNRKVPLSLRCITRKFSADNSSFVVFVNQAKLDIKIINSHFRYLKYVRYLPIH